MPVIEIQELAGRQTTSRSAAAIQSTLAYHATMLPLLCITLILLMRSEAGRS